jgi:hypothetical protein
MPEIGTYSLSGGRRPARWRASSDPTAHLKPRLLVHRFRSSTERIIRGGPKRLRQPKAIAQQSAERKPGKRSKAPAAKNAPAFDLSSELERITGVDLTRIDGIEVMGS